MHVAPSGEQGDLTLHASVERATPTFIVRILCELGESGNLSGEGSTPVPRTLGHFTHSMGKEGRIPRNLSNLEQPRHTTHEMVSYGVQA